jgi:1-acyl-sn-glycerol-3-phosphate acyltransferase
MPLYHVHPPCRPEWQDQTAASECTPEALQQLRKFPRYPAHIKLLHILLFLVFGPPKILLALAFTLTAGTLHMIAAHIWMFLGRPDSGRSALKISWLVISRVFMFILGFHRIRYHGLVDHDARFFVANHTCFFDGWLFTAWGPRILAKKEMLNIPLMRENADIFDAIAVDRSARQGLAQRLVENAKDPNAPMFMVLPEGASTSGDYMLKFHIGAFLSDLPVQPAAIRYTIYGLPRSVAHIAFFHHQLYQLIVFLGIPSVTVDVHFLDAMSIKTFDCDPKKFALAVSLKIANFLGVRLLDRSSSDIFTRGKGNAKEKEGG